MDDKATTFAVRVIIFQEDATWVALALEMDLRGYGPTSKAAADDLLGMIQAQVSYAVQMGHAESVWHPAEERYFKMFEETRKHQFVAQVSGSAAPTDRFADMVPLPRIRTDAWAGARG